MGRQQYIMLPPPVMSMLVLCKAQKNQDLRGLFAGHKAGGGANHLSPARISVV